MKTFVFEISHLSMVLQGLRKLKELEPQNADKINGVICWMKYQITGQIGKLEPFMRNQRWIKDEIEYEQDRKAVEYHDCSMEGCKKPCRGKFCADCWKTVLAEIHDCLDHTNCKKES